LANICRSWDVAGVIRGGSRLESVAVFSDDHLLRWAKGLLGGNAFHFETIVTPRRRLAWEEAKENAEYCLKGNEAWRTLIRAYFDDIEKNHPDATMAARIYNPCNLMMGFYRLAKFNAGDMLASAEVIVSDKDGSPLRLVFGGMVWNGKRVASVADVLPDDVPTLFDLYFAGAIEGGTWDAEEELIARHGLSYVLVECTPASDGFTLEQLVIEEGALRRLQANEHGLQDFGQFFEAHGEYLSKVVEDFDSWASFG
jgi:hypothetical protein